MTLVPIDPSNEASVVTLLERAAQWLAEAVHRGEPGEVAMVKAQLATAAEATKQLNLSKDIQLDAQEMVRRAEYALGKAIRRGQGEGLIRQRGFVGPQGDYTRNGLPVRGSSRGADLDQTTISPKTLVTSGEELHQVYTMSDGVEPDEFDAVIEAAKAEGNLSRANVVRKMKGCDRPGSTSPNVITRDMRAEMIRNLADQGYSSRQMVEKVGVTEETVRLIARDFDIEIPADKVVGRQRRLDHTAMVRQTVIALSNEADALKYIDFAEVDFKEADEWVSSLTASIAALNRFKKQIKENTHV